jgi:hypothetical protein
MLLTIDRIMRIKRIIVAIFGSIRPRFQNVFYHSSKHAALDVVEAEAANM